MARDRIYIEKRLPIYEAMYRNGEAISAQLLEDLRNALASESGEGEDWPGVWIERYVSNGTLTGNSYSHAPQWEEGSASDLALDYCRYIPEVEVIPADHPAVLSPEEAELAAKAIRTGVFAKTSYYAALADRLADYAKEEDQ